MSVDLAKFERTIGDDVLNVLRTGVSILPHRDRLIIIDQLDRGLYERVRIVLENYGGKWSRKEKAHVFQPGDMDRLLEAVEAGVYADEKKAYQFFPTPLEVAQRMVRISGIVDGDRVLEPSAGTGTIALAACDVGAQVDCVELHVERAAQLLDQGFRVAQADFLDVEPEPDPIYDCVLMNPPFSNLTDCRHVQHAAKFVKPGGMVLAIMASSWRFSQRRIAAEFRDWIDAQKNVAVEELPEGTFKASGTNIAIVMVRFEV